MQDKELIKLAFGARKRSYAPYSGFKVGAALMTREGMVFTGCNIENAGLSSTNCAERTAIFKAVSEGYKNFERIVIVGAKEGERFAYTAPCGVCRQVLMEFCDPKIFEIILAISENQFIKFTLEELLPMGFGPNNIMK